MQACGPIPPVPSLVACLENFSPSNGCRGSPRGLGCREQLAPCCPVTTQPEEALHRLMRSQRALTISRTSYVHYLRWNLRTLLLDSGVFCSNVGRALQLIFKTTEKEGLQGGEGDKSRVIRHRHIHDPGIQQEPCTKVWSSMGWSFSTRLSGKGPGSHVLIMQSRETLHILI